MIQFNYHRYFYLLFIVIVSLCLQLSLECTRWWATSSTTTLWAPRAPSPTQRASTVRMTSFHSHFHLSFFFNGTDVLETNIKSLKKPRSYTDASKYPHIPQLRYQKKHSYISTGIILALHQTFQMIPIVLEVHLFNLLHYFSISVLCQFILWLHSI